MKREHVKQVKLSDDERKLLKEKAELNHMTECDYVRMLIRDEKGDFIKKTEVAAILLKISQTLDKYEIKEKRVVKILSKEYQKLWKLL